MVPFTVFALLSGLLPEAANAANKGVNMMKVSKSKNTQGLTDTVRITKFGNTTIHVIGVDIDAKMPAVKKAEKIAKTINDYLYNGVKQFNAAAAADIVTITDTNGNNVKKIEFDNLSDQKWDAFIIAGAIPPTEDQVVGSTTVTGTRSGVNGDGEVAEFKVGAKVGTTEGSATLETDDYGTVTAMLDAAVSSLQGQGIAASRDGNAIKVTLRSESDYFGAGTDDTGLEETLRAENIDTE
jgi:hypothetical protein